MKLILLLGIFLLSGCALMGVYGPDAQEGAKEGLVQIGNSLDQITNTAARGAGAYASGYAQGYQQYQATQPQPIYQPSAPVPLPQYHSGMIITPGQAPSIYSGYGNNLMINGPNGTTFINGN